MDSEFKILVVDDDEMMRDYISESLSSYYIYTTSNVQEAKLLCERSKIDLLIVDIRLKDESGLDLIRYFRSCGSTIPVIIITGYPDYENVRISEKMEVHSYVTKPFTIKQIQYSVKKGLEKRRMDLEKYKFDKQFDKKDTMGLIGTSEYICLLRKQILNIASSEFPVLIQGASGTGKDVISNAIHLYSKRSKNSIITVNCAAIPIHLEEAEFFGYAEGAFTGASHARQGIIAMADKSTLFLDEIGELSLGTQAKLLRILENGEFLRIGENVLRKVDIRIISATKEDLEKMIVKGSFREDLYYRLKGEVITTRPINEHQGDIPALVYFFIKEQSDSKYPNQITSEAMAFLVDHPWPGDIRELKQMVNILCHSAKGSKRINTAFIESVFKREVSDKPVGELYMTEKTNSVKKFEFEYFTRLLQKYRGNLTRASGSAGMDRSNLIKKIKNVGISADDFR